MYNKKDDIYIEDFLQDINEVPFMGEQIPWINAPQINSGISIET